MLPENSLKCKELANCFTVLASDQLIEEDTHSRHHESIDRVRCANDDRLKRADGCCSKFVPTLIL
jgi:hypothetical protein